MLKWVGTLSCVVCAAALLASIGRLISLYHWNTLTRLSLYHGTVLWQWYDRHLFESSQRVDREYQIRGSYFDPVIWKPQVTLPFVLVLPLWIPFVAVSLPTAFLRWRDRRRIPRGHCQTCGYELTGNVSGRCPECGSSLAGPRYAEPPGHP